MKKLIATVTAIVGIAPMFQIHSAQAMPPSEAEKITQANDQQDDENKNLKPLKSALAEALKTQSLEDISSLYEWSNAPYTIRDQELFFWRDLRFRNWKDDTKVTSIEWITIEKFSEDQLNTYRTLIKGQEMNGNTYISNVPVLGLFSIHWMNKDGKAHGSMTLPVGKQTSGKYILVSASIYRKDGKEPK